MDICGVLNPLLNLLFRGIRSCVGSFPGLPEGFQLDHTYEHHVRLRAFKMRERVDNTMLARSAQ